MVPRARVRPVSVRSLLHAVWATAKISVPTVLEAAVGRVEASRCDRRLASWARELVDEAELSMVVTGSTAPGRSVLVLSNHESLFDIPVLFCAFPGPLRMVAKKELFSIPIWGRAMRAAGFVPVDRSRGDEARRRLREAGKELEASGRSLWMAPEGTRGDGRNLLPFKSGAFDLARELGLPIAPVSLEGTSLVLGKHARQVQRGRTVGVHFHPLIEPSEFPETRDELRAFVFEVLSSRKSKARGGEPDAQDAVF